MESESWFEGSNRDYVNLCAELMPFLRLTEFFGVPKGKQPNARAGWLCVLADLRPALLSTNSLVNSRPSSNR